MATVLIREGPSGIVTLSGARSETFVPDYDLDQALELLHRVYDIQDGRGKRFKDNYHDLGFNWLSAQINFLYSRCIYRLAQYRRLLEYLETENLRPIFLDKNNFYRAWSLLHPVYKPRPQDFLPYRVVLPWHNRALSRDNPPDFLFYRYGPDDFRTAEMLAHFQERKANLACVYTPSRKLIRQRKSLGHPAYFLFDKLPARRPDYHSYNLKSFDKLERRFLQAAILALETGIARQKAEYSLHLDDLHVMQPKLFFGLEDLNRLHPLLFACKALGIPSLGYQTGTYSSRQAANVLPGWGPGEFQYFDRMIIWGKYWEDVTRKNSDAFSEDFFILGANKHTYGYRRLESPEFHPKNVLVPYEYLANTRAVGRYIVKLQALGYTVYFKLKPDWDPERQVEPYHLPDESRNKLILVKDISDEFMAKINIVAGTMTTLLFDLLPYGKETWIFETDYRLLDDLAEFGYARKVGFEELDYLTPPAKADNKLDTSYIFNDARLQDVLDRYVLSSL